MSLAALERRLSKLEAGQPPRGPHEHGAKLYLLGGDGSEPPDGWVNEQIACAGCDDPGLVRAIIWPPGAWTL